jgi:pimeloyl-ACP methyl ester carboxylesterase
MKNPVVACAASIALGLCMFVAAAPAAADSSRLQFQTVEGAGGVPLNVATAGDPRNPAVLLVHGLGQSYLAFENQLNSALREHFFLVAFDLRGHGNSGKPWRPDAYAERATWAGDVESVVTALHLRRPVLAGWSYGTAVVMDYVRIRGTQDVAGVVLTGGYGGLMTASGPAAPPSPDFARLRSDLVSLDLDRRWAASRVMAKYLTARPMPEAWLERATAIGLLVPPSARIGMLSRPMDNSDLIPKLQTLPMLFVIGAKEAGAPTEAQGRQLVAQLAHARLTMHPEDGHSPFIESPEQFNRELSEFLESLPPVAPTASPTRAPAARPDQR